MFRYEIQDGSSFLEDCFLRVNNLDERLEKIPFANQTYGQKINICRCRKQIMEQAWRCFEKAREIKNYNAAAQYFIISFYYGYSKALVLYQSPNKNNYTEKHQIKLSKTSSPTELLIQGIKYALGLGVNQNYNLAVSAFQLAADKKNLDAQYLLGLAYSADGWKSISLKVEKVVYLYQNAKRHPGALCKLGFAYSRGLMKLPRDKEEGQRWYQLAADQGYAEAQYQLGQSHIKDGNLQEGIDLLSLAVEQGHMGAQVKMASYYYYGSVVSKNQNMALRLYRLAGEQGFNYTNKVWTELRIHTPFSSYLKALLEKNDQETAQLLIDDDECRQEFIDFELGKQLGDHNGIKRLTDLFNELFSHYKLEAINGFILHVLVVLYNKINNSDDEFIDPGAKNLIVPILKAINLADIEDKYIQPLMQLILNDWWDNPDDFSGYRSLKTLWHRAYSIHDTLNDPHLRKQIASFVIKYITNNTYTLGLHDVSESDLGLLFLFDKDDFNAINKLIWEGRIKSLVVNSNCEYSPINLIPKLYKFVSDKTVLNGERPALIQSIADYLSEKLTNNKVLDERRAVKLFTQLSTRVEIMLNKSKKHGFFAIKSKNVEEFSNLLLAKDFKKLLDYISLTPEDSTSCKALGTPSPSE